MKNVITLILLAVIFSNDELKAQPAKEGVQFFKGTWNEALAAAKEQQKLIFVDVYTDWCAPCKRMDAEIFSKKEVGVAYNKLFINFKMNAEKGEGIKLAGNFAVKAYPTWLFVDETGNVVLRELDYMEAEPFIALGNKAESIKNDANNLSVLEARFDQGERSSDFLKSYLRKRTSMKLDNTEVLNAYVKQLSKTQIKQVQEILFLSEHLGSKTSDAVLVIVQNLDVLSKEQAAQVSQKLYRNLVYYEFSQAIKDKRLDDGNGYLKAIEVLSPFLSDKENKSVNNLKLHFYREEKNKKLLAQIAKLIASEFMSQTDVTIAEKNNQIYQEILAPFVSGEKDSTKIPGFSDELKMMKTQYSAEMSTRLYTVADACLQVFDAGDQTLKDSLKWAEKANAIHSNAHTEKLVEDIKRKISL